MLIYIIPTLGLHLSYSHQIQLALRKNLTKLRNHVGMVPTWNHSYMANTIGDCSNRKVDLLLTSD